MKKTLKIKKRIILFAGVLILLSACTKEEEPVKEVVTLQTDSQPVIEENENIPPGVAIFEEETETVEKTRYPEVEKIVKLYEHNGDDAWEQIEDTLSELKSKDPETGAKWEEIMILWKNINEEASSGIGYLNYDVLPDGLSESDDLCIVVLGFQLNSNGTIKDELKERLIVAKNSALKYPNARILCTGVPHSAARQGERRQLPERQPL